MMMKYLLRTYIRELVTEITQLPKEYFSTIDNAIRDSRFWTLPNHDEDIEGHGEQNQTPAASQLQLALDNALTAVGLDMDILVDSYPAMEGTYLDPGHPAYPNRWLIDARWYVSEKTKRNTLDLMIMTTGDDFDASDMDPAALTRHIAQTIRHELVHYSQMKKQQASKKLDGDWETFKSMLADPKQIPASDDIVDYLKSHIEIDAHAHDAAEELLAVYGEKGAKNLLRGKIDISDPKLPNAIQHYYTHLPKNDPTLKLLRKKMYQYIESFKN